MLYRASEKIFGGKALGSAIFPMGAALGRWF